MTTNTVSRVTGVVDSLNRQGTGLKLKGGEWHNYSLPQYRQQPWDDVMIGDVVVLGEVESNGRWYVQTVEVTDHAAQNAEPVADRQGPVRDDRPIVTRLAVLNTAARIYAVAPNSADANIATQDVIAIAETLLTWVNGQP